MKKVLETNRLILRDFNLDDYKDMYEYARLDNVGPSAGWPVHENEEESKRVIESFMKDNENYAIILKENNKLIGSIGIHKYKNDERFREIGYVLNPNYWHHGYMSEAVSEVIRHLFEELSFNKIYCAHFDFNDSSKKVILRQGFRYIHDEKRVLPLIGKIYNTLVYEMTLDMYLGKKYPIGYFDVLENRFSVREFSEKRVDQTLVNFILYSAKIAPTAVNFQPQRIIVIDDKDILSHLAKATRTYFNSPLMFLICHDESVSWHRRNDNKDHGIIDSSIVASYMMLTASSLGLSSTYVCSFKEDIIRETLNIPDNYKINCLLPVGYAKEGILPSKSHFLRKEIEDFVFYNRLK